MEAFQKKKKNRFLN